MQVFLKKGAKSWLCPTEQKIKGDKGTVLLSLFFLTIDGKCESLKKGDKNAKTSENKEQ